MSLSRLLYKGSGKSIEEWLELNYEKAYDKAKRDCEAEDGDYLFSGRTRDKKRNIERALNNLVGYYIGGKTEIRRMGNEPMDNVGVYLPMLCLETLVSEIKSAAYGDYYYKYEKRWD